jgi:hypothetical protein
LKQLVLAVFALSVAAFAPVSTHHCQQVHRQVMQPVKNVLAFLKVKPDLDSLSGPGCLYILQQFNHVPEGAELLRRLATQRVENASSRCLYPMNSVRYDCTDSRHCLPQAYSYCGQWEYSLTNASRYELAMELAFQIDTAFDKAQQMCGAAMRWDELGAMTAMKDLHSYLDNEVNPLNEKVYAEVCAEL